MQCCALEVICSWELNLRGTFDQPRILSFTDGVAREKSTFDSRSKPDTKNQIQLAGGSWARLQVNCLRFDAPSEALHHGCACASLRVILVVFRKFSGVLWVQHGRHHRGSKTSRDEAQTKAGVAGYLQPAA
jgi:hypothetical protein